MNLDELKKDIISEQKKGLPFIMTSVIIWGLIAIVLLFNLPMTTKNILVFCCSCPLLPISWTIGKKLKVDIFSKENPLGQLGLLFTMNQMLYLLIVMWVFNAVPDKMVMVYAMVFGAHLLPYSWLYQSNSYRIFAIIVPMISLLVGNILNGFAVAATVCFLEVIFVFMLFQELKQFKS